MYDLFFEETRNQKGAFIFTIIFIVLSFLAENIDVHVEDVKVEGKGLNSYRSVSTKLITLHLIMALS